MDFIECKDKAEELKKLEMKKSQTEDYVRYEAAVLISLAHTFNESRDIEIYASRAGINPEALGLDFISSIRRSLLVAALRTLEGK